VVVLHCYDHNNDDDDGNGILPEFGINTRAAECVFFFWFERSII
jgi:hypothetical protein